MTQWCSGSAMLPHSNQILVLWRFYMKFACSPRVCVGSLSSVFLQMLMNWELSYALVVGATRLLIECNRAVTHWQL